MGADSGIPFNSVDSFNMLALYYDRYSGGWYCLEILNGSVALSTARKSSDKQYFLNNKIRVTYSNYWFSVNAVEDIKLEITRQSEHGTSTTIKEYTAGQNIDGMTTNPTGDNTGLPIYTYRII